MWQTMKEVLLPNGLTVSFLALDHHYYGDFHLVKVDIFCKITISVNHFNDEAAYDEARALLGAEVEYRRQVQQMAVPGSEIQDAVSRLISNFEKHSLPYIADPQFPRKYVMSESAKIRRKINHLPSSPFLT